MSSLFFPETLPPATNQITNELKGQQPAFLKDFYLSGGTALSLQLGHRESEDLDFFTAKPFNPQDLERQIHLFGILSETELSEGTLNTFINGVKIQFLYYPYQLIKPILNWDNIPLSSIEDIACTKLQTVSMRGSKKDFIDIYFLLKRYSLSDLLTFSKEKYAKSNYSQSHILKSLVYFFDAEAQPMPKMHQEVSWGEIKSSMVTAVKSIPLS